MSEFQAEVAAGNAAPESDPPLTTAQPGATDTPETVEETDEQKNARELNERQERAKKRNDGIQRRFDELTRDKYAERQARERAERDADELRKQLTGRQQQPEADGSPKRESFADYEAYIEAKAEYKAEQKARAVFDERTKAYQQAQHKAQAIHRAQRIAQEYGQRVQAFAKEQPDFANVANDDTVLNDDAISILLELENAPALIYALHKSPQLVERLNSAPANKQGVILGEISASLKKSPQVSNAPAAGAPVGGKASPTKSLADMDYDEYVKARRRGQKQ
jgi:DNA repair exonuclease SbcCD ATPase subunit